MCQRGSPAGRRPPPRDGLELRLRTAEPSQASRALALDEGPQPLMDECGAFRETGELAGLGEQGVVDVECGAHDHAWEYASEGTSCDDHFNAYGTGWCALSARLHPPPPG